MSNPLHRYSGILAASGVITVAIFSLFKRAGVVDTRLGSEAGHGVSLFSQAVASDLWLLGAVAAVLAMGLAGRNALWRLMTISLALLVGGTLFADAVIYEQLSYRLWFADIVKFGQEFDAITAYFAVSIGNKRMFLILFGMVVAGFALFWIWLRCARSLPQAALLAGMSMLSSVLASMGAGEPGYVHEVEVRNWLANSLDQGVDSPYSPEYIDRLKPPSLPSKELVCQKSDGNRANVIVLVVESLSAYHSGLLSGRGWTPKLDQFAQAHSWSTNFHANGFTTDHGLIALLTGRLPLPALGRYHSTRAYDGFEAPEGALPQRMQALGYSSQFFTTGDLGFLDKGKWARKLGFNQVEGAEHSFYDGQPRFHFNAAPDRALYDRFLDWYNAHRDAARPFVSVLLTVSSHAPYRNPETGEASEEAAIRYADREAARFAEQLQTAGFFNQGVLLIVGDHRAMTPVSVMERERFGERAFSRVPLILAGRHGLPSGRSELLGQQIDLVDSLATLASGVDCPDQGEGRWFPKAVEPAYVAHVRGDRRSWLNVYARERDAILEMRGDASAWLDEPSPAGEALLSRVALARVALGMAPRDGVMYLIEQGKNRR